MRLRYPMRFRAIGALAGALALATAPGTESRAEAGAEWCEVDPLIVVTTPRGALVTVFVTNGALGLLNLPFLLLASMKFTVTPVDNGRKTQVNLTVVVPHGLFGSFATRSTASTFLLGTGKVLGTVYGRSGQAMQMTFTLDVP
ncbi:MAG TPA: hypothetical protein VHS99_13285 [Chloroflexota bacterium]|jgi:hypothetical protein|nr:hypothetical protein [Chloroflexota bacterium]